MNQIRKTVVATVNNQPIDIDHIVEGGPLTSPAQPSTQGVVAGHQTRLGKVGRSTRLPIEKGDIVHFAANYTAASLGQSSEANIA